MLFSCNIRVIFWHLLYVLQYRQVLSFPSTLWTYRHSCFFCMHAMSSIFYLLPFLPLLLPWPFLFWIHFLFICNISISFCLSSFHNSVPSESALIITGHNKSSTSIQVNWKAIRKSYIHGVLRGYVVLYRRANETNRTTEAVHVGPDTTSLLLRDLWIYTKYAISIYGFTNAGDGRKSKQIVVSTDESGKSANEYLVMLR